MGATSCAIQRPARPLLGPRKFICRKWDAARTWLLFCVASAAALVLPAAGARFAPPNAPVDFIALTEPPPQPLSLNFPPETIHFTRSKLRKAPAKLLNRITPSQQPPSSTKTKILKFAAMQWLLDERIWCPPNITWSEFGSGSAKFADLKYSLITAMILILTRAILENTLFRPIGRQFVTKQSTVFKIGEGLYRFTFYLAASIYGWFFVLWDKPYLKDTMHSLYNYPHHPVEPEEWWYYNIELGFYVSLVFTQIIDTKRKDFWQMFVHHIVTILLLVLSWVCNFHRIGALVLAIHDVADVPLELAKLAKYCNMQRPADLVFAIFTCTWIYTRCYLLPTRVIYYTSYEALKVIPFFPAYYIFNGLLCLLQALHLAWTWLIMRMVFYALKNDGMRDLRSESEDSEKPHAE